MAVLLAVIVFAGLLLARAARVPQPAPARGARPRPHPGTATAPVMPQPGKESQAVLPDIAEAPASSALDAMDQPELLYGFQLLNVDDLPAAQRADLGAQLSTIALPPRSTRLLMSPEFLADTATREFTDLVMHEPLLAGKVIGRVNSAFYALSSPIVSVSHAVTYLGLNAIRTMALQFTLEQAFASEDAQLQEFHARLFDAGTVAAELCTLLAPRLGISDVSIASTQAVLSFLGDFAMPSLLPQDAAIKNWPLGLLDRTCNEQFAMGTNAGVIGALMMEEWDLPQTIRDDVRDINLILVAPCNAPPSRRQARLALSFICARIGERISLGRVQNPEQIKLLGSRQAEHHHLQSYLRYSPLQQLPRVLQETGVRLAIARLIAASERSRSMPVPEAD